MSQDLRWELPIMPNACKESSVMAWVTKETEGRRLKVQGRCLKQGWGWPKAPDTAKRTTGFLGSCFVRLSSVSVVFAYLFVALFSSKEGNLWKYLSGKIISPL